ncbi:MAG: copper resistance protein NlpE N-terminal domain-containing protein [Parafilimonas sp.]|nr:copper resistance protein NlpE N-terminal domain-containing protein [Parafilimonas sp.]
MKLICIISFVVLIISCNSDSSPIAANDSAFKTEVPRTPVIKAENYVGTLPCADCEGIDVTLQLKNDSSYIMNSVYKGSKVDSSNNHFVDNGTWSVSGDTIILSAKGNSTKYIKSNSTLTQLDGNGKVITGPLADNFVLHKK